MSVNTPNECQQLQAWLNERIRALPPHELLTGVPAADVSDIQVTGLEALVGREPVEEHLVVALAARSVLLRSVTAHGGVVMVEHEQLTGCERIAKRILELRPDPDMEAFARDLLARVEDSRRWVWVGQSALPVSVAAVLVLGLLPVVLGGANGHVPSVVFGVLVGAVLTFALVVRHRRQVWLVRAESLAPLLASAGR